MAENAGEAVDAVAARTTEAVGTVLAPIGVGDVFSDPVERDGSVIFTAAAVERAGGFGFGAGEGDDPDSGQVGGGGGGGGGGAVHGRPVAVISVDEDGVTVTPVIDFTRIGIAVLAVLVALRKGLRR